MNIRLLAAFCYLSFAAMTATAGAAGEVTLTVVNHSVYGITIRTANGDDPTGGHCNNGDVEAGSTVSLSCPSIHQQDWAVLAFSHQRVYPVQECSINVNGYKYPESSIA